MPYAGFYINLDRSPDRRAEIESELARHNLAQNYRRFAAADGNALKLPQPHLNKGEMGCFISHYLLLKENLGLDRHLHVVEDDTIFGGCFDQVIRRIIANGEMDAHDILYTDVSLPLANDAYKKFKTLYDAIVARDAAGKIKSAAFQILKVDKFMRPNTNSFLIHRDTIAKIHDLFQEELTHGAELPVDALLREKIETGDLRAGCVFPFITSVRVERVMHSLVRKVPDVTLKFTASAIARYSFFIDCDWDACERLLAQLPQPPASDFHAALLARILEFSLLDERPQAETPRKIAG